MLLTGVSQGGPLCTTLFPQETLLLPFNAAQVKVLKKFDPSFNQEFLERLSQFRGDDFQGFDPRMHGREGQIFTSSRNSYLALKRFFKAVPDVWVGVSKLQLVRERAAAEPRIDRFLAVVAVHERGSDWILRDFDPHSLPLKSQMSSPQARQAYEELLVALRRTQDPLLRKVYEKIHRRPISENLHWSPTLQKILLIDFSMLPTWPSYQFLS